MHFFFKIYMLEFLTNHGTCIYLMRDFTFQFQSLKYMHLISLWIFKLYVIITVIIYFTEISGSFEWLACWYVCSIARYISRINSLCGDLHLTTVPLCWCQTFLLVNFQGCWSKIKSSYLYRSSPVGDKTNSQPDYLIRTMIFPMRVRWHLSIKSWAKAQTTDVLNATATD